MLSIYFTILEMARPVRGVSNPGATPNGYTMYGMFTGRRFQFVLFALSISCFICGYVMYSQIIRSTLPTYIFHGLYKEFQIVCFIYVAMGLAAFVWLLLDVLFVYPEMERQRQQEIIEEIPLQSTSTGEENVEEIQLQSRSAGQESSSIRRRHVTGTRTTSSRTDMPTSSPETESGGRVRYISLREYDNIRTVRRVRFMLENDDDEEPSIN